MERFSFWIFDYYEMEFFLPFEYYLGFIKKGILSFLLDALILCITKLLLFSLQGAHNCVSPFNLSASDSTPSLTFSCLNPFSVQAFDFFQFISLDQWDKFTWDRVL